MKCSLPLHENERQCSVNNCWPSIMVNHSAMWPFLSIYIVLTVFVLQKAHEYWVVPLKMKLVVTVLEDVPGLSLIYLPMRLPSPCLWMLVIKHHSYYRRCKTKNRWRAIDAHFQDGAGSVSHSLLPIKSANTSFMTICNLSPPRLPKMHDQESLTLRWHSFLRGGSNIVMNILHHRVADALIMGQRRCTALWVSMMQDQKLSTLHWRSFLGGGSDIVTTFLPIKAADELIMGQRHSVALRLAKMQDQKLLTLRWHSFLGGGSDIVTSIMPIKAADTLIMD